MTFQYLYPKGWFRRFVVWKTLHFHQNRDLNHAFDYIQTNCTDIVFDIGANVGQFSIPASRILPKAAFYLFEPAEDGKKF
jgi:hypothetical protein